MSPFVVHPADHLTYRGGSQAALARRTHAHCTTGTLWFVPPGVPFARAMRRRQLMADESPILQTVGVHDKAEGQQRSRPPIVRLNAGYLPSTRARTSRDRNSLNFSSKVSGRGSSPLAASRGAWARTLSAPYSNCGRSSRGVGLGGSSSGSGAAALRITRGGSSLSSSGIGSRTERPSEVAASRRPTL